MTDFAKRISAHIDASIMKAVYGGTSNIAPAKPEALTIDTLKRAMLSLPPRETWLSSKLFPSDSAFCVEGAGERFTCAHPGFWLRLEDTMRRSAETRPAHSGNQLGMNLTPIEIDAWAEDAPDTAVWRAAHWDRLHDAVEVAMVPLPDWLRGKRKAA